MKLLTRRTSLKKKQLPQFICGVTIMGIVGLSGCFSDSSSEQEYVEETEVVEFTQGVITEVEEAEKDLFKITDETIVPTKEESRIIASYLDGARDTFTLEEVQLVDAEGSETSSRRSGLSSAVTGGLMGYFIGRSLSSPRNPGVYKNTAAYNKSGTTNTALRSTAKTRTVRKPATGKSGFGGTKSTRSYGG